jgi:hypothetical protein
VSAYNRLELSIDFILRISKGKQGKYDVGENVGYPVNMADWCIHLGNGCGITILLPSRVFNMDAIRVDVVHVCH